MGFETLYTIEQVAEMIGVSKSTLRYWERIFSVLVPRSGGGQRRYNKDSLKFFITIKELSDEGYAIRGIKRKLI